MGREKKSVFPSGLSFRGCRLSDGDFLDGEMITRVSDSFAFFGKKRIGWSRVSEMIDSGVPFSYGISPNAEIDWSCPDSVRAYHASFRRWGTYVSNGDSKNRVASIEYAFAEEGGLIFHDGKWFVKGPHGTHNDWGSKGSDPMDGVYSVELYSKHNAWWGSAVEVARRKSVMLHFYVIVKEHPVETRDYRISSLLG